MGNRWFLPLAAILTLACAASNGPDAPAPGSTLDAVATASAEISSDDVAALTALGLPDPYVQSRAAELAALRLARNEAAAGAADREPLKPVPVPDHPTASLELELSEKGDRLVVSLAGVDAVTGVQFGLECSENVTLSGWAAVSGYLEIPARGFPKSGEWVAVTFHPETLAPGERLRIGSVKFERKADAPDDPAYVRIIGVSRDFDRAMVVDDETKSARVTVLGGVVL